MDVSFLHAEFVQETAPLADEVEAKLLSIEEALRSGADTSDSWRELLNLLHTIKGNCGIVHFSAAQSLAHVMEDRAKAARGAEPARQVRAVQALIAAADALRENIGSPGGADAPLTAAATTLTESRDELVQGNVPPSANHAVTYASYAVERAPDVRISAEKLDRLLELVGELATYHGRVTEMTRSLAERVASSDDEAAATVDVVDQLGKTIAEFRAAVTQARLLRLSGIVGRFRRLVRDVCVATGKTARFETVGADTVVDKTIVDAIGEPLLHLLRNAVDHGIERPEVRAAAGKPAEGRIALTVAHGAGELWFVVEDDGGGISRAKLAKRAEARGIVTEGWADDELIELIFLPDMSTAETVTELSGRGIGMDAARRALERIGGSITVSSEEGLWTRFLIRVPLTLTLQRVLLVACRREVYAIGLAAVIATTRIAYAELHAIDRRKFVRFRGKLLPVLDLPAWLGVPEEDEASPPELCVVVEDGARTFGLLVSSVLGQQDVVLKELDASLGKPVGIAGATVLADGRVAMVLDARAIVGAQRGGGAQRGRGEKRGDAA